ncbi:MAG: hypothetical protein AAF617_18115, partial [Bacteroidota bacterium]
LTPEMSNLRKLSFLTTLMKSNFATKHKEGIEVTTADYEAYTEAILVAKENYNKLLDTNPEFKNLEAEKQKEVFMASIQKNAQSDLKKIGNCFFSFSEVGECFTEATLGSKIVFGSCVFLTGAADIYAAIQLGAAFVLSIEPVIKGELAFCTELAFTTSVAACIITIQANIIICIANEFGITYNP